MDLKIKDVAELLNVSKTTIRRWLADGKIPAYRLNHQYRFNRGEIESWLLRSKIKSSQEEDLLFPFKETQIYPVVDDSQKVVQQRGGLQQFCLYRAIHNGIVLDQVAGVEKEEIIRGTMNITAPRLGLDQDVLSELLLDREKLMPTAINKGIAVPHTRDFLLQGAFDMIVVVYPLQPIEYGALDGKPVHTLFFLFSSNDKRHLNLLAKLAHLANDPKALQFLQTKPEKKELLEYIKTWEAGIRQPSG